MESKRPTDGATKTHVLRFRLTDAEYETICHAAHWDKIDIESVLKERGLNGDSADSVGSPTEWVRRLALNTAIARLRARKVRVPLDELPAGKGMFD